MSGEPQTIPARGAIRDAIDLRRFAWIRPLVTAYANDFAAVAPLFAGNPTLAADWRDAIARVRRAERDRAALGAILERQLTARGAPPAARAAATALRSRDTVAVVTGQQAGAFGGPLYTLLKAITAIQLARRVEAEHGQRTIPVFWVDEEDHDWDEVRTARVLDANGALHDVQLPDIAHAGSLPVARLELDDRISTTLEALQTLLPPTEFTSEIMATLRRRYSPGTNVGTAFAGWLDDLLGEHGLVVFEAGDREAKPLVADLFVRELRNPGRTARLAREAADMMARLGHEPQVQPADDAVALFYLDEQGRRPIKRSKDAFVAGDSEMSPEALTGEAAAHPERFSPNVLLRPIVQDRLFPTICYVAGPSELAYQAQLGAVYREFGVEPPLLYSRSSVTLLDSGAARFLDRSQLPLEALSPRDDSTLNRLLQEQLPPMLEQSIAAAEQAMADRVEAVKAAVLPLDPTLSGAVDTTLEQMRKSLRSLHGKIIQAAKRKDDTLRRQFTRSRALTFPDGVPQERALCVVFFVNRYGPAMVDRLLDLLPLETDKHYVVTL